MPAGRPTKGDTLLLILNGGSQSQHFVLPRLERRGGWQVLLDTVGGEERLVTNPAVAAPGHSLILCRFMGDRPGK